MIPKLFYFFLCLLLIPVFLLIIGMGLVFRGLTRLGLIRGDLPNPHTERGQ